MSEFQLVMPKMGESIAEATIIRWTKNEGDSISVDETVLEIATDKVDSEVPSPKAGKLIKRLFNEGDVVPVNAPIAIISLEGSAAASAPVSSAIPAEIKQAVEQTEKTIQQTQETITPAPGNRFYSPLVLNIAKAENISMAVLETIAGTGAEGRVTKRDILAFVQNKGNVTPSAPQTTSISPASTPKPVVSASVPPRPPVSLSGGDEIIDTGCNFLCPFLV